MQSISSNYVFIVTDVVLYSQWCVHWFCQVLDNGLNIIQLETAVGAGIKSFEGAIGMLSFLFNSQ